MSQVSDVPAKANHLHIAPSIGREIRYTAQLGAPLALGEVAWMSTYIIDALMIGRLPHSAVAISASSLGNTIFYAIAFGAIGLLTGLEALAAQFYGQGDQGDCKRSLAQSLFFVLIGTPVVMLATLGVVALLPRFGTPPEIHAETVRYTGALIWSTGPLLLFMAFRRYLQAMDRVLIVLASLIAAAGVNALGDWVLLYGHLGSRAMGIAGSGWATCLVRLASALILLVAVVHEARRSEAKFTRAMFWPDWKALKLQLLIGWPASIESFLDLGVSTFMSILCARLGATLLAAHQVVLDLDALVYMVPAGLGYAAVVRVGQCAGRRSLPEVRRAANAGMLIAGGFIAIAASLFAGFPHLWAGMYTNDAAVVMASAPIFLLCGLLQVGDAFAVILSSAFTGLGDTRTPLIVNSLWSWAIGMPLSYWLTFHSGMALEGLWIGRCVAAVGAPIMLALLWRLATRNRPLLLSPAAAEGAWSQILVRPLLGDPDRDRAA